MTPTVVGIDLGTTYSLAAYVENGRPVVVRDPAGDALVPSVISFHPDGTVLVGTAARDRALSDPEHTIFSVKRLMGRTLADLQTELKLIPHQITERPAGGGRTVLTVRIGDREHTPEELSAMILREVRQRAGNPARAVITVPAYFDDSQRQATRDAGRIAGLDVLRIVNEPTAAALAYGLDRQASGTVAVYDLGGGTFDCSILTISDGVFKVLSTNGDTYLGGDDFDRALMEVAAAEMGIDLASKKDPQVLQALRDQAERVKIALSASESAEFVLTSPPPRFGEGGPGGPPSEPPSPLRRGGSTDGGAGEVSPAPAATSPPYAPLSEAGRGEPEHAPRAPIPEPPLPEAGRGGWGKEVPPYRRTFTRSEFESLIAPLIDRSLAKCRNALKDAELKASQIDQVVLVGGSTRIPYVRRRVGEFFGRTPHTELNPDEVVALGAAVQADILTGGRRHMLLLDVIPLSLGIETLGGVVDKVIHRNTTVPARATTRYSTSADGQTAILINIFQGERELTKDCKPLGTFKLGGIPPMPAGLPQVDVTFLVNENGMLTVSAKEQRSGQEASVTVQAAHGLSPDEVDRMVLESVEHAHADFTARCLIEFRNKGEADLRHTETALAEAGDQLTPADRSAVATAVANLKAALAGTDVDALQRAVTELGTATRPLAEVRMNAVVKKALSGKTEAAVRAGKL